MGGGSQATTEGVHVTTWIAVPCLAASDSHVTLRTE